MVPFGVVPFTVPGFALSEKNHRASSLWGLVYDAHSLRSWDTASLTSLDLSLMVSLPVSFFKFSTLMVPTYLARSSPSLALVPSEIFATPFNFARRVS